jgi:hypothetical protein
MFHIDPNTNTALQRQAERVRAVRAYGNTPRPEQFAPDWGAERPGPSRRVRRMALALAAVAPIVLIVAAVVLLAR